MASKSELESIIARQTAALKAQMAEIEGLRAENQRLNDCIATNHDALVVLQELYSNRGNPVSVIMKAADAAIPFERSRMPTASIGLDLTSFAARLAAARRGEVIESTVDDEADEVDTA
jgi:hypothetical protein